jgi:hypothetical protein
LYFLNVIQHNKKAGQFFGAAKVREFEENKGIKVNLAERIIKALRDSFETNKCSGHSIIKAEQLKSQEH